jgi:hypothetical protein
MSKEFITWKILEMHNKVDRKTLLMEEEHLIVSGLCGRITLR